MKLILAIVSADVADPISRTLIEQRYTVTHISSIGGFLRRGSVTLVIGVAENQVEDALVLIRKACQAHKSQNADHAATIFVIDAGNFVQV